MSSHIPTPSPKPLELLTRPQVAARVGALRMALDLLADQSDRDGAGLFSCVGAMKRNLIGSRSASGRMTTPHQRRLDSPARRGNPPSVRWPISAPF